MRARQLAPAALAACLLLTAPALAAPWAKVTSSETTRADQVSVLYGSDTATSVA